MKTLNNYICEKSSLLSQEEIDTVKNYLIKKYNVNSWKECVDKQRYGDCDKICKDIINHFSDLFDTYAWNLYCDFSEIAQRKLNDDDWMNGNHYVLLRNGKIYDFCKGANSYNGIYVLTQYEDMRDKYEITWSKKEKDLINIKVKLYYNKK